MSEPAGRRAACTEERATKGRATKEGGAVKAEWGGGRGLAWERSNDA